MSWQLLQDFSVTSPAAHKSLEVASGKASTESIAHQAAIAILHWNDPGKARAMTGTNKGNPANRSESKCYDRAILPHLSASNPQRGKMHLS